VACGVLPLAACSIPREADLASGASGAGAPSPSPSLVPAVSVPASPTPTPSASPTPFPTTTPARVRPPTPKAVKGYTLSAAPRSVPNPLAGVKGANEVFGAMTVRSVSAKGTPVGLLFLFAVRPQHLSDPQVTNAVVSRLANSISRNGVPLKEQKLGRQTVSAGSSAKNGTIVLWYRRGVLSVVVGGGDKGAVLAYAKALAALS
jgi:hypothetical protein